MKRLQFFAQWRGVFEALNWQEDGFEDHIRLAVELASRGLTGWTVNPIEAMSGTVVTAGNDVIVNLTVNRATSLLMGSGYFVAIPTGIYALTGFSLAAEASATSAWITNDKDIILNPDFFDTLFNEVTGVGGGKLSDLSVSAYNPDTSAWDTEYYPYMTTRILANSGLDGTALSGDLYGRLSAATILASGDPSPLSSTYEAEHNVVSGRVPLQFNVVDNILFSIKPSYNYSVDLILSGSTATSSSNDGDVVIEVTTGLVDDISAVADGLTLSAYSTTGAGADNDFWGYVEYAFDTSLVTGTLGDSVFGINYALTGYDVGGSGGSINFTASAVHTDDSLDEFASASISVTGLEEISGYLSGVVDPCSSVSAVRIGLGYNTTTVTESQIWVDFLSAGVNSTSAVENFELIFPSAEVQLTHSHISGVSSGASHFLPTLGDSTTSATNLGSRFANDVVNHTNMSALTDAAFISSAGFYVAQPQGAVIFSKVYDHDQLQSYKYKVAGSWLPPGWETDLSTIGGFPNGLTRYIFPSAENFVALVQDDAGTSQNTIAGTVWGRTASDIESSGWDAIDGDIYDQIQYRDVGSAVASQNVSGTFGTTLFLESPTGYDISADSIAVSVTGILNNSSTANLRQFIDVSGTRYWGTASAIPASNQYYSYTWSTNPAGGAWTSANAETISAFGFSGATNTVVEEMAIRSTFTAIRSGSAAGVRIMTYTPATDTWAAAITGIEIASQELAGYYIEDHFGILHDDLLTFWPLTAGVTATSSHYHDVSGHRGGGTYFGYNSATSSHYAFGGNNVEDNVGVNISKFYTTGSYTGLSGIPLFQQITSATDAILGTISAGGGGGSGGVDVTATSAIFTSAFVPFYGIDHDVSNDVWVAVGFSDGFSASVARSTDGGITWSLAGTQDGTPGTFRGVTHGSAGMVAVADYWAGDRLYHSSASPYDTWYARSITGAGISDIYDVTWSQSLGLYVAVAETPYMFRSPDGVTWDTTSIGNLQTNLYAVEWNGTQFVAVGGETPSSGACIVTSPDGINWTQQYLPSAYFGSGDLSGLTSGDGSRWVAVGASTGASDPGSIFYSDDGSAWTYVGDGRNNVSFGDVTYDDFKYIAVGEVCAGSGTVFTSPSATSWTFDYAKGSGTSQNLNAIAYGGSGNPAIAVGGVIAASNAYRMPPCGAGSSGVLSAQDLATRFVISTSGVLGRTDLGIVGVTNSPTGVISAYAFNSPVTGSLTTTGSPLASAVLNASAMSVGWNQFTFPNTPIPSGDYAIVFDMPVQATTGYFDVGYSTTGDGNFVVWNRAGTGEDGPGATGAWTVYDDAACMSIDVSAQEVPVVDVITGSVWPDGRWHNMTKIQGVPENFAGTYVPIGSQSGTFYLMPYMQPDTIASAQEGQVDYANWDDNLESSGSNPSVESSATYPIASEYLIQWDNAGSGRQWPPRAQGYAQRWNVLTDGRDDTYYYHRTAGGTDERLLFNWDASIVSAAIPPTTGLVINSVKIHVEAFAWQIDLSPTLGAVLQINGTEYDHANGYLINPGPFTLPGTYRDLQRTWEFSKNPVNNKNWTYDDVLSAITQFGVRLWGGNDDIALTKMWVTVNYMDEYGVQWNNSLFPSLDDMGLAYSSNITVGPIHSPANCTFTENWPNGWGAGETIPPNVGEPVTQLVISGDGQYIVNEWDTTDNPRYPSYMWNTAVKLDAEIPAGARIAGVTLDIRARSGFTRTLYRPLMKIDGITIAGNPSTWRGSDQDIELSPSWRFYSFTWPVYYGSQGGWLQKYYVREWTIEDLKKPIDFGVYFSSRNSDRSAIQIDSASMSVQYYDFVTTGAASFDLELNDPSGLVALEATETRPIATSIIYNITGDSVPTYDSSPSVYANRSIGDYIGSYDYYRVQTILSGQGGRTPFLHSLAVADRGPVARLAKGVHQMVKFDKHEVLSNVASPPWPLTGGSPYHRHAMFTEPGLTRWDHLILIGGGTSEWVDNEKIMVYDTISDTWMNPDIVDIELNYYHTSGIFSEGSTTTQQTSAQFPFSNNIQELSNVRVISPETAQSGTSGWLVLGPDQSTVYHTDYFNMQSDIPEAQQVTYTNLGDAMTDGTLKPSQHRDLDSSQWSFVGSRDVGGIDYTILGGLISGSLNTDTIADGLSASEIKDLHQYIDTYYSQQPTTAVNQINTVALTAGQAEGTAAAIWSEIPDAGKTVSVYHASAWDGGPWTWDKANQISAIGLKVNEIGNAYNGGWFIRTAQWRWRLPVYQSSGYYDWLFNTNANSNNENEYGLFTTSIMNYPQDTRIMYRVSGGAEPNGPWTALCATSSNGTSFNMSGIPPYDYYYVRTELHTDSTVYTPALVTIAMSGTGVSKSITAPVLGQYDGKIYTFKNDDSKTSAAYSASGNLYDVLISYAKEESEL